VAAVATMALQKSLCARESGPSQISPRLLAGPCRAPRFRTQVFRLPADSGGSRTCHRTAGDDECVNRRRSVWLRRSAVKSKPAAVPPAARLGSQRGGFCMSCIAVTLPAVHRVFLVALFHGSPAVSNAHLGQRRVQVLSRGEDARVGERRARESSADS
jgi:hypothetical protein